jgi:hypothetical protein
VLEAWAAGDPPLDHYEAGAQGPASAAGLLEGDDTWRSI